MFSNLLSGPLIFHHAISIFPQGRLDFWVIFLLCNGASQGGVPTSRSFNNIRLFISPFYCRRSFWWPSCSRSNADHGRLPTHRYRFGQRSLRYAVFCWAGSVLTFHIVLGFIGISLVLSTATIYILLRKRRHSKPNVPMIIAAILMPLLATAQLVVDCINLYHGFIPAHTVPERVKYFNNQTRPVYAAKLSIYFTMMMLGDAIVVRLFWPSVRCSSFTSFFEDISKLHSHWVSSPAYHYTKHMCFGKCRLAAFFCFSWIIQCKRLDCSMRMANHLGYSPFCAREDRYGVGIQHGPGYFPS